MVSRQIGQFDMRALTRVSVWATAAAVALALAALTTISNSGSRRAAAAIAALTGESEAPRRVTAAQLIPNPSDAESERRRLNEAIRLLTADRDRLLTRMGAIERNLDDLTGSITRQGDPPSTASNVRPQIAPVVTAPETTAPQTLAPAIPSTSPEATYSTPAVTAEWMIDAQAPWASPSPAARFPSQPIQVVTAPAAEADDGAAASVATRTEFGVDIGGAASLNELKELWNSAKRQHGRLLGGLRPVVFLREGNNGGMNLRLIVGPLANATAAARLCGALGATDVSCSIGSFEGQQLAAP
jgi:hypothetical protein